MNEPARESVGRGTLVALAAIPAGGALGLAPVPLEVQFLYWVGVVAAVPLLARFLYTRASGGYLVAGRGAFVAVTVAALLAALVGSVLTTSYAVYVVTGGRGGMLDPEFIDRIAGSFTRNQYFGYGTVEDFIFGAFVATAIGGASTLFSVLSARRPPLQRATPN